MRRDKPQRRRGVLLSDCGLSRVFEQRRRLADENDGVRLSLETFSLDVGLSTRTLSRLLNRASPVDFRTVETLFFALHLVPDESDYYYAAVYPEHKYSITELPRQLTPLIGRETVLDVLENLLRISRLLTLTGAGGIGKTRLAIELARRVEATGGDRVWFFDLSAITDERQSVTSVATALGIAIDAAGTFTTIREQLSNESGVLVLDNCENVAATLGPFVLNLLSACPLLRVLSTSREPLGIVGERVFRVPPLLIPERVTQLSASGALRYPAVTLFVERARSSNAGFTIDDSVAPAIAEIVQQLDGLPLGIELAAARAGEMSPTDLLAYLQTRLTNLGSERQDPDSRHRSMRALMDWSFERLTELEQAVYCRACIFSGSFDATALAAVCSDFLLFEGATDEFFILLASLCWKLTFTRRPRSS